MHRQAHVTLVNGSETSAISIADRGLAYGDGLFETMRVVRGKIPLLPWHLERFKIGVERLALGNVIRLERSFKSYVKQALDDVSGDGLLKLMLTRGVGGKGYQPPITGAQPTFILQLFDLPDYEPKYASKGVKVKVCDYRLPANPVLAGIKHLNRLDQVLASRELKNEQEGLVCDMEGNVIEGLKSNLILFEDSTVVTPLIDRCGVRGSLRQYLISRSEQLGFEISEEIVPQERLRSADGAALVNSIFGCWPVVKIDQQTFPIHARCETIQQLLKKDLAFT